MKKSIIVAIVAMSIIILASIYSVIITQNFKAGVIVRFSILFLILFGLIKGHRLVWQWGRLLTILAFVGMLLSTIMILSKGGALANTAAFFLFGLPALIIFISFGTHSAKEHFSLICPNCSAVKVKADDFLFNKAKCKNCNHVW